MMEELEIDQSNLPRVREVCQCFAVLEDGVLAHSLQEQEIEQFYTTNVQKNQLVQNDIRVAKRLQDEEDERRAERSALLRQASRQLEEEDFEYARAIQEEIQRGAEEARRREQDDEEMAKRMQEEEEQRIRRVSRGQRSPSEGGGDGGGGASPPSPDQPTFSGACEREERFYPAAATVWQRRPAGSGSDVRGPQAGSRSRAAAARRTSRSNEGHLCSINELRERLSADSDDSDSVFSELMDLGSRRNPRAHDAPRPRSRGNPRSAGSGAEGRTEGYQDSGRENRGRAGRGQEGNIEEENGVQSRGREPGVRERRCGRSQSVMLPDRSRTWTCRDNADKHVRFRDDGEAANGRGDPNGDVWRMLGHVLRERGVPVRLGDGGVPLKISPQSKDPRAPRGSGASCGDSRPHQTAFRRAAAGRHSFHGDVRVRRSLRRRSGATDRGGDAEVPALGGGDAYLERGEGRGGGTRSERRCTEGAEDDGLRRAAGGRWRRAAAAELLSSEEEQQVDRNVEKPRRRASQRGHGSRRPEGASLPSEPGGTSLDLGELQQVLRDEELARKLQEEEERLSKRASPPSPSSFYPQGDFRVAQVAQDEEIARFMQKQEIKSKRRSGELEGPSSWREHHAMISLHERRAARERLVQRERLDSEGLLSPAEDGSPENQPPSPTASTQQTQQIRNIAEELDPTFQARRPHADLLQTGPGCRNAPAPHSGLHDFLDEPTFIPPTKRQTDKAGRPKPKEKKENCKQQ